MITMQQIRTSTFYDSDQFLESLKVIDSENVNVLFEPYRIWIGYLDKGSILIQEFKDLDELLSFMMQFSRFKGKHYSKFIEPILANLGKTSEDILNEILYTGKEP